ncbi:hypothetical protein ACHAXA_002929 [Cyclostephanos tholiformis]|uniref:LNS2/PITP domain-containing protein n=1 Tax=Cyclostephanos tholiformis TaxID=382380 RepID=A0ABD3RXR0_9STRA
MNSSAAPPSSSAFSPPPPTSGSSPHGSASGSALDVIVIVPSSSSSSSAKGGGSEGGWIGGGVPSSSDFYVTFPPGLAWTPSSSVATSVSTTTTTTTTMKTSALSLSASVRRLLPDRRVSSGGIGVDVALVEGGGDVDRTTTSHESNVETNSTSITHPSRMPSLEPSSNRLTANRMVTKMRREGNVQVRINGRYIPQLDMIFSSTKQRITNVVGLPGSLKFFGGGSSVVGDGMGRKIGVNNDETSCRFVDGNGLRPPEEAFNALLYDGNEWEACDDDDDDDDRAMRGGGGGAILCHGRNLLRYTLFSRSGVAIATAEAHLYLWRSCDSVVVSDIDGTVTRSDVRGVIDTVLQDKFQHVHDGICQFYHAVMDAGNRGRSDHNRGRKGDDGVGVGGDVAGEVRFLYLSSRPISFVNQTRKLLVSLSQSHSRTQRNYGLPPGPIMCHTGPLSSVLYSELVAKDIYQFKADVLARQVVIPFVAARGEVECMPSSPSRSSRTVVYDGPSKHIDGDVNPKPKYINGDAKGGLNFFRSSSGGMSDVSSMCDDRLFLAGFGNKMTDAVAYEMAGIDRGDIYIIDKESRILCMGETERNYDSTRSIMCDLKEGVIAQSEYFLPGEECCPGGIDRQLSSELSASAHDEYASSALDVDKVAKPIHSIELSLKEERRFESLDGLFTTATTVDVYVTSDKEKSGRSATSRWAKAKQIRRFSSRRNSFMRFPSFGSSSSGGTSSSSSKKIIFRGYDDPLLFARIRERMVG